MIFSLAKLHVSKGRHFIENLNKMFVSVVPAEWFLSLEHDSPSLVTQEHLRICNPGGKKTVLQ
jgi:hypothetical protein